MPDLPQSREEWREKIRKDKEKKAEEEAQRREAAERESAKREWLRDGGTLAAFQQAWPGMRDEKRKARVEKTADKARTRTRATLKTNF